MMTSSEPATSTTFEVVSDLEVVMSRIFEAPRELVFEVCTQPRHMSQWWGPRRLSLPVCEMEARAGGRYRFVQRDEDGNEYGFSGEFKEIVAPERVVMTQVYDPYPDHPMLVSLTFEDLGAGRTRLVDRMRFDSVESRDATIAAGMEAGARESYDRLAEHLQTLNRGIWMERVFEAPRALVFDVWTNPKHVAQWWGPAGYRTSVETMDVRPGREWRFVMHAPDGAEYPNRVRFIEVERPSRLVYDHFGDDPNEEPFRGFVTFYDEGPKRTRLIMRTLFPTPAVRDFVSREYHAVEGMQQTLDRLNAYLLEHV